MGLETSATKKRQQKSRRSPRFNVIVRVPYVAMGVPLAAESVYSDLLSRPGVSLCGNTQMSAPVSMRNLMPEALSCTNRRRDVMGQVSLAAINDCPAGFPAPMYRVRYICWPYLGISSGTNIFLQVAAPWTGIGDANAGANIAEAVLCSHWTPLAHVLSWRPFGFVKLTVLVSVGVCECGGWHPPLPRVLWGMREADCILRQRPLPSQAASFQSAWSLLALIFPGDRAATVFAAGPRGRPILPVPGSDGDTESVFHPPLRHFAGV
jgi:hypothetical protein